MKKFDDDDASLNASDETEDFEETDEFDDEEDFDDEDEFEETDEAEEMDETEEAGDGRIFKSGFVSILGVPNVGKSTLLNKIIGEKIAIVSHKAQTTRNSIQGIKTGENYQIVFVDTPGFHSARSHINKVMVHQATETIEQVDVIYLVTTPKEIVGRDFKKLVDLLKETPQPKFLIINKVDASERTKVYEAATRLSQVLPFTHILPVSAVKGTNVDKLIELTVEELPEGRAYFDEDEITTQPEKFLIAEYIREKVFQHVHEEIPYDTLVETEKVEERPNGAMYIAASVIVSRESQKGVIIGKGGKKLKEIGQDARKSLEAFFGVKVYLDLWVKIRDNWSSKDQYLEIQGLQ